MGRLLNPCLTRTTIVILLLVVSIPITIGISSNIPITSTIFQHQQAMAQNTIESSTMPSFLTYVNSTYGIKMQYPSDWLYKEAKVSNNPVQTIVTFVSPNLATTTTTTPAIGSDKSLV